MSHPLGSLTRRATGLGMIVAMTLAALPSFAIDPPADQTLEQIVTRMQRGCESATTLSADLVYSVSSAKRQQLVRGSVRLMKPNLAKVTYDYLAEPPFPCLVGCDGQTVCTFTPASFREDRTFEPGPFDPLLAAREASAIAVRDGRLNYEPAGEGARRVKLWDAAPLQAFFDPIWAARQLYSSGFDAFELLEPQVIDGVRYDVLYHCYQTGNIAGGANSDFDQRLYVAPDGLIHQYVLEFHSAGARGVQVARLMNIETNALMTVEDFGLPRIDESVEIELPGEESEEK